MGLKKNTVGHSLTRFVLRGSHMRPPRTFLGCHCTFQGCHATFLGCHGTFRDSRRDNEKRKGIFVSSNFLESRQRERRAWIGQVACGTSTGDEINERVATNGELTGPKRKSRRRWAKLTVFPARNGINPVGCFVRGGKLIRGREMVNEISSNCGPSWKYCHLRPRSRLTAPCPLIKRAVHAEAMDGYRDEEFFHRYRSCFLVFQPLFKLFLSAKIFSLCRSGSIKTWRGEWNNTILSVKLRTIY